MLRALGPFDIEQAVVVIDGHVVGVEDIEGTDGFLARIAALRDEPPDPGCRGARRPGQGAQTRSGLALRPADDRPAHGRRRGARRAWRGLRLLPATRFSPSRSA